MGETTSYAAAAFSCRTAWMTNVSTARLIALRSEAESLGAANALDASTAAAASAVMVSAMSRMTAR